jgi:hypothetical protein
MNREHQYLHLTATGYPVSFGFSLNDELRDVDTR